MRRELRVSSTKRALSQSILFTIFISQCSVVACCMRCSVKTAADCKLKLHTMRCLRCSITTASQQQQQQQCTAISLLIVLQSTVTRLLEMTGTAALKMTVFMTLVLVFKCFNMLSTASCRIQIYVGVNSGICIQCSIAESSLDFVQGGADVPSVVLYCMIEKDACT
jgi:hypothetical protein